MANAQALVFESPESGLTGPYRPRQIRACAYRRAHEYVLGAPLGPGSPEGNAGVASEVLAGSIVAYESFSSPGFESGFPATALIIVRDLRTGKVLHKLPTGQSSLPRNRIGIGAALSLVVSADGAVAWIAGALPVDGYYQVHAVDRSGSRVLATGQTVEPHSLALAGRTLYWTQNGAPFSTTLS